MNRWRRWSCLVLALIVFGGWGIHGFVHPDGPDQCTFCSTARLPVGSALSPVDTPVIESEPAPRLPDLRIRLFPHAWLWRLHSPPASFL